MHLHVSSTCADRQESKIVLYNLWYHHTETSEGSKVTKITKITKIQFYKYEHIVVIMNSSPNNIPTNIILCLTSFIQILQVITHLTPNPQFHAFHPVLSQPVHGIATYRVSTFNKSQIAFSVDSTINVKLIDTAQS